MKKKKKLKSNEHIFFSHVFKVKMYIVKKREMIKNDIMPKSDTFMLMRLFAVYLSADSIYSVSIRKLITVATDGR